MRNALLFAASLIGIVVYNNTAAAQSTSNFDCAHARYSRYYRSFEILVLFTSGCRLSVHHCLGSHHLHPRA
ncbi:MAG: hypothetical protein IPL86_15800 [Flavobacteriales bacterium]|nr:hypothetical protein [Flavobacteriales bacterium]